MKKLILSSVIALALLSSCGGDGTKSYQCPMKCEGEKTYDTAGKCPMCQMDMKEVK
ncbi:hypothetical protein BH11BAC7_BH11BAC7_05930 [soil metagenome]